MSMTTMELRTALAGCLMGTAAGDALGLRAEGLSRARQARMLSNLDGPRLIGRRGMVSDDTDHTLMVARALIVAGEDANAFASALGCQMRVWLLGLPAGVGLATLKACIRLLAGYSPKRSGVFSAGNGPAMRAPILGVACNHDPDAMRRFVRAATRITHTDPKAEWGAFAVALAAAMASSTHCDIASIEFVRALDEILPPEADEFRSLIARAVSSAEAGEATDVFADSLGLARGVSGYVYHTVPVVLQTWLRHQADYRGGVLEVIRCGGDTDTTAAILGGIIGARVGEAGIPPEWLDRLWLWPGSLQEMEALCHRLADVRATGAARSVPRLLLVKTLARNAVFTAAVLAHGFRRILPPYA